MTTIPDETKAKIIKLFAENLHINKCPNNHAAIKFDAWPHTEGYGAGTCETCGLVIPAMLPGFVVPYFESPVFVVPPPPPPVDTLNPPPAPKTRKGKDRAGSDTE